MIIVGETVLFGYTRSRAARDAGIMYDVDYHDMLDGSAWISTGAGAVTAEGPLESVEAIIPMSSAKRRFVRLRVSMP